MMGREHIQNIKLLKNTAIVGIVEPDEHMRAEAMKLLPGVQFYSTIAELLAIKTLDCLVIVSPNHMHVEQLQEIATTRPLPILVEKPLATSPEQIELIENLIETYPEPIWVAMEYRYMPVVAKLIEQAEEVTGGIDMLSIREHRFPFLEKVNDWNRFNQNSGGTFVEKCCHFFDLMRLIIKSEPVSIMASCGQAHNHLDEVYDGRVPDILDHGYVIVNFESGARAMLELCMFAEGSRYQEEISIVGAKGKIECFVPGPGRFWPEHLGAAPVAQVILSPRKPQGPQVLEIAVDPQLLDAGDHNGSTFYQHQKFQQVVLGNQAPEVSLNDGLMAVRMGLAAQKSSATGETVKIN
ncbi:MAG: Gfo/Idh/MocA family oxidoreductase [Hyphomicrobiales bacterium]|nr:Gfo/Idh/MocA family oxidoreductase [Hyphomicrobiales bacterium]